MVYERYFPEFFDSYGIGMDYTPATIAYMEFGMRTYQAALIGGTDESNADALYDVYKPSGVVVDMGCGIGGVLEHFHLRDPSLELIGVSNDQYALDRAYSGAKYFFADFTNTQLPSGCADVVMFNESAGYGDLRKIIDEAFRVLKPGGKVCFKDFDAEDAFVDQWGCRLYSPSTYAATALEIGVACETVIHKNTDWSRWDEFMATDPDLGDTYTGAGRYIPRHCFAATHVIRKPVGNFMPGFFGGDVEAARFIADLCYVAHVWDDLVDGDKSRTEAEINKCFQIALINIPANRFYQQHINNLLPILHVGALGYMAANSMERSGDAHQIEIAHGIRYAVAHTASYAVAATNDEQTTARLLPRVWTTFMPERFEDYRKEHCHVA